MERKLWKSIQELFYKTEISFRAFDDSGPPDIEPASQGNAAYDDVVRVRSDIRKQFDLLRVELTEYLTEQEAYYVLFPLVIFIDEQVQSRLLDDRAFSWPLLQRELFEIDDGGKLFYDTLDHILRKPEISQFVFEVYYFCLKHGFQGKYVEDPIKIPEYLKKLEAKIRLDQMMPQVISHDDDATITYLETPLIYYAMSAGFIVVIYLLFVIWKHIVY